MLLYVKIPSQKINGDRHRRDFSDKPEFSKTVKNLKRTIVPSRFLIAFYNFQYVLQF